MSCPVLKGKEVELYINGVGRRSCVTGQCHVWCHTLGCTRYVMANSIDQRRTRTSHFRTGLHAQMVILDQLTLLKEQRLNWNLQQCNIVTSTSLCRWHSWISPDCYSRGIILVWSYLQCFSYAIWNHEWHLLCEATMHLVLEAKLWHPRFFFTYAVAVNIVRRRTCL